MLSKANSEGRWGVNTCERTPIVRADEVSTKSNGEGRWGVPQREKAKSRGEIS